MPGHVLLADCELVGQRLHGGLALHGQVLDDPNAHGLTEDAQALRYRLEPRLGDRLRLSYVPHGRTPTRGLEGRRPGHAVRRRPAGPSLLARHVVVANALMSGGMVLGFAGIVAG